ncbi:MAG: UvrABC system protein B [Candidatus Pacebacteria bacterium GW2011_GWF2_38_9]|nr:MAG: excinuclease ABC subunit B, excinuclease ABC subunit B [candidate division TM6 bacterium GW2011_GWF2_28_16]KKQ89019.1 MAG: UvrABC system protein B [Candidatus Pacebacteria bacterium GW2011_GWF2_38_9]HAZ73195.1 excinuclease ABC subunit B [Candidatus Paceibacterota bacterium]
MKFKLHSPYQATGDQPQAIEALVDGIKNKVDDQVLLGVTGSGKTFTIANVIEKTQKATLVIAHNKTLAAQLYQELRDFFPENAVSYFVSYYDYYQPEAYLPSSDTYIEKEATINEEIDKLRLAATTYLMTRPDVIIVASVSCIYGLGSPADYSNFVLEIVEGELIDRQTLLLQLSNLQYERSNTDLLRGSYRLRGDVIQLWPAYQDTAIRIETLGNEIISIKDIDPISGAIVEKEANPFYKNKMAIIYPAKHYMVESKGQKETIAQIRKDMEARVEELKQEGKSIEAYRLEHKVNYDLEMIEEFGSVNGIENYSRYFDGRQTGEAPYTLLDYFKYNQEKFGQDSFLTVIDESHISLPQIKGMYFGDRSRKETLINYGFRLPSAIDNRPLQLNEFLQRKQQAIYVSATPNEWELQRSKNRVVEQLVRPTGLLDPKIDIRPTGNQVEDLTLEIIKRKKLGQRVLVTTLTKKMAEALSDYLNDHEKISKLVKKNLGYDGQEIDYPEVAYLHSDVKTLDRSDILDDLRNGKYDVLVGINLLREGLDLPEVSLVAILDADKEGFLRSSTALIQTMGRAARHVEGLAILYADKITKSMDFAIKETTRRREVQEKYNLNNKITPIGISKPVREKLMQRKSKEETSEENKKSILLKISSKEKINLSAINSEELTPGERQGLVKKLRTQMKRAASDQDFELAAIIRDKISEVESS